MSDIGQLRTAAQEARTAFARASSAAGFARKSQVHYEFAERQWRLSHSGETREPVPIIEGNSRWDIPMKPPPSDEEVKRLERAAAKSERKLDKAAGAHRLRSRRPATPGAIADGMVSGKELPIRRHPVRPRRPLRPLSRRAGEAGADDRGQADRRHQPGGSSPWLLIAST